MKSIGGIPVVRLSSCRLSQLEQFCSTQGEDGETVVRRTPGRHRRRGVTVPDEGHLIDEIDRALEPTSSLD